MFGKNRLLPEERIPTFPTFPRQEVYFNEKKLEAHGFPKEVSKAFLRTADDTNCVVMSRVPGPATTGLIRAGHDLKGFLIKAKSCTWGPMAGFLCQIPALNKYGSSKISYNYKKHKKYLEYRQQHNFLQTPAFIPLKITKKRKDQILKSATSKEVKSRFLQPGFFKQLDNNTVAGLAFPRDDDDLEINRSVVVEFLMVRHKKSGNTPELWSLYHGNIFYRPKDDGKYLPLFNKRADMDGKIDRKKMPAFFMKPVKPVEDDQAAPSRGGYLDANQADKKAKQKEREKELKKLDGLIEVSVQDVLDWQSLYLGEDYKEVTISDEVTKYFVNSTLR